MKQPIGIRQSDRILAAKANFPALHTAQLEKAYVAETGVLKSRALSVFRAWLEPFTVALQSVSDTAELEKLLEQLGEFCDRVQTRDDTAKMRQAELELQVSATTE